MGGQKVGPLLTSRPSPSALGVAPSLAALSQGITPLAVGAVSHEAVAPHELLAAAEAVVGLQARVGLHVLREVVLHLELFGTDGAVEGPQVQVHVNMAVPHALMSEGFSAVTHKNLPRTPSAAVTATASTRNPAAVHAINSQSSLCRHMNRSVLQAGVLEGSSSDHTAGHPQGRCCSIQRQPRGLTVEDHLVTLHVQGEELGPGRRRALHLTQQRRDGAISTLALSCGGVVKVLS